MFNVRHLALLVGLLVVPALSGCEGRRIASRQRLMDESLMGQMSVMCNSKKFLKDGFFASRATDLGYSADGGTFERDRSIDAEITDEQWIAHSVNGKRSTVWRGVYGPGEFNYSMTLFVQNYGTEEMSAAGSKYQKRAFDSAIVCVAHAPYLTRREGWALATTYGINKSEYNWMAGRNASGQAVTTSLRMINGTAPNFWREIEFIMPPDADGTGVTIVRRHFIKNS